MGVTIEKCRHRARIGAHNNVKIKVDSTQLASNFCDTMLMLFQNNMMFVDLFQKYCSLRECNTL